MVPGAANPLAGRWRPGPSDEAREDARMSRPAVSRRVAFVLACGLAVGACHGGSRNAAPTTTRRPTSTATSVAPTTSAPTTTTIASNPSTAVTTTTAPSPCAPTTGQSTLTGAAPGDVMLLTAVQVRATAHCADAVTFTFRSAAAVRPGVRVMAVHPPFLAASGKAIAVAGSAFYEVRFEPADTFDFTTGKPTYTGPGRITPTATSHVREVVNTEAFEGVVTWIVGVASGDRFRAELTSTPPALRLVFAP